MSLLSKLFGRGKSSQAATADPEPAATHKGCRIYVKPEKNGAQYRVAARIEKDFGTETKSVHMIRADSFGSLEQANEVSLWKAKQFIDQMGDRIF